LDEDLFNGNKVVEHKKTGAYTKLELRDASNGRQELSMLEMTDHMKQDCPKAGAIRTRKCSDVSPWRRYGWTLSNDDEDAGKGSTKVRLRQEGTEQQVGANAERLKEALPRLMTLDDDEEDADGDCHEGQSNTDDAEDVFFTGCSTCELGDPQESDQHMTVQALMAKPRRLIIDSGCRGAYMSPRSESIFTLT